MVRSQDSMETQWTAGRRLKTRRCKALFMFDAGLWRRGFVHHKWSHHASCLGQTPNGIQRLQSYATAVFASLVYDTHKLSILHFLFQRPPAVVQTKWLELLHVWTRPQSSLTFLTSSVRWGDAWWHWGTNVNTFQGQFWNRSHLQLWSTNSWFDLDYAHHEGRALIWLTSY